MTGLRKDRHSAITRFAMLLIEQRERILLASPNEYPVVLEQITPPEGYAPHVVLYGESLDESRRDGTASVVAPLLQGALQSHEHLLTAMREVVDGFPGDPIPNIGELSLQQAHATSQLLKAAPGPPSERVSAVQNDGSRATMPNPKKSARDAWLYEKRQKHHWVWSRIAKKLQSVSSRKGWSKISENGIKAAVTKYAHDNNLPLDKGHGGRPKTH